MKRTLIANLCIALVLVGLGAVVFTVDIGSIYLTVSAPLSNGNRSNNNVSLMIGVSPQWHDKSRIEQRDEEFINAIYEILHEKGVDATWFLSGGWIARNLAATKQLAKRFELGNHAYSQIDLRNAREAIIREEIQTTCDLLAGITGCCTSSSKAKFFIPPNGHFNRRVLRVAEELGYRTINNARFSIKNYQLARSGDLIWLTPDEATVAALPQIIDHFLTGGFNVVRVGANVK